MKRRKFISSFSIFGVLIAGCNGMSEDTNVTATEFNILNKECGEQPERGSINIHEGKIIVDGTFVSNKGCSELDVVPYLSDEGIIIDITTVERISACNCNKQSKKYKIEIAYQGSKPEKVQLTHTGENDVRLITEEKTE